MRSRITWKMGLWTCRMLPSYFNWWWTTHLSYEKDHSLSGHSWVDKDRKGELSVFPLSLLVHRRCNVPACLGLLLLWLPWTVPSTVNSNKLFFLLNLFVSAYLINAIGKETKTVLYVIFLLLKNIKCYMWLGFSSPLNGVDFISSFIYKDLWWLTLIVNMTGFKITMETFLLACVSGIF